MVVTVFKSINDVNTPFFKEVFDIFDRIREGNSRDLLEKIRQIPDKETRNKMKKDLPSICFSGKFERREAKALVEHSGLICLDYDGFASQDEMLIKKATLTEDKFTFALFVSPSGDGLKQVVKIPQDPNNHRLYFNALNEYFDCPEFDTTTKDVCRVCYESYDPDIYVNEFSFVWDVQKEDVKKVHDTTDYTITHSPTIRLNDDTEVVRRLLIWWEREFGMVEGAKNNNLHLLAMAFNEFGISESHSADILLRYDEGGKRDEILLANKSAYKKIEVHATKFYEDSEKIDEIKKEIKQGRSVESIVEEAEGITDKQAFRKAVEYIVELNSDDEFWVKSSKGKVTCVPHLFRKFLTDNGYYKYYHAGSDKFIFVRVTNNMIDDTTDDVIKDFVLGYLDTLEDKSIYNYFAGTTKLFKEDFLSFLQKLDPKFIKDTEHIAHLYYRTCALRITKGKVEIIDYIDLDGFVWRKQIIDRDFVLQDLGGVPGCEFEKFIGLVGGSEENIASIESTIGFGLHGFKPPAYCPAVIINDEKISENPEGGTGKGLFIEAIGKLKRQVIIDGKDFKFDKAFPYQTVSADTQILTYDDVVKNFDFEKLFSIVTQGITLEKKNKDAIKVPFDLSPKVFITSNYAIKGRGNSFERRKWELEFRQYFTRNHTPREEFGRMMFIDWDKDEWNRFDNYMVGCLKGYLATGFVKSTFRNVEVRKFIADTSFEFYEWSSAKENEKFFRRNVDLLMQDMFSDFIEQYPDYSRIGRYKLSQNYFYKWLESYAVYSTGNDPVRSRSREGNRIRFVDSTVVAGKSSVIREMEDMVGENGQLRVL